MHYRFLTSLASCMALVVPAFAQITASPSIESVSGCAAVVSTTQVCATCMTIACVVQATITAGCGDCPTTAPTIYRGYPCDEGCGRLGGCKTLYSVVTASDGFCDNASPTPTQDVSATTTTASQSTQAQESLNSTSVSTAGAARLIPLRLW